MPLRLASALARYESNIASSSATAPPLATDVSGCVLVLPRCASVCVMELGVLRSASTLAITPAPIASIAAMRNGVKIDVFPRASTIGAGASSSRTLAAAHVALATNVFPSLLTRNRLMTVPVYDYVLATEPLDAAPTVSVTLAGEPSSLVTCTAQQTSPTTSEHRCGVSALVELETPASLVVTLVDLAKNEATVTLSPPFFIDTRAPSPPESRGALLVASSPWGDAETGFRPSTRVLPARALTGARQLLFRKGGVQLGTATLERSARRRCR